ncbi:MAG: hypothetical protein A2901_08730 [Elusimicrobia bacterium RIFCSPLOWO2_01_FULL_54_10]|nr:MAG: hypothetical protein A2901_08730 [Elusimicrobia bacterium RIFCSPLOWO2_01_FULL_54_10]
MLKRFASPLLFVSLAVCFFTVLLARVDPDYFWRLKNGEMILTEGRFPMTEIYSYTSPGARTISNAWVSEVILYAVHHHFGYAAQAALHGLLLAFAHLLIFIFLKRKAGLTRLPSAALTLLCALNTFMLLEPRTQNFGFIFFVLSFFFIADWDAGDDRAPYFLAFLLLPWVNLHSGFVIGIIELGLLALGKVIQDRKLSFKSLAPLFLGILLSCFNPEGIHAFNIPTQSFKLRVIRAITEAKPLDIVRPELFYPYLALLSLLAIFGIKDLLMRRFPWMLLLLALLYQSLTFQRMIPYFAVVCVLCLGFSISGMPAAPWIKKFHAFLLAAAGGTAIAVSFITVRTYYPWTENLMHERYPRDSVRLILENYPGKNIFSTFEWGGYLLYYLHPNNRISLDSRTMPYLDFIRLVYLPLINGAPEAHSILDRMNADIILLPNAFRLTHFMRDQKDWNLILDNGKESLFAKKDIKKVP